MAPPTMAPPISPAATPAATPRCALTGVAASEPAIVATATKAANVFFILGPSSAAWRAATRPPHHPRHQEIPAAACQSPAGHRIRLTECIRAGFELLVATLMSGVSDSSWAISGLMQRSIERALFEVPPAVRRHHPNFLVEVDFGPPHSQNFAGPRSGQNAKFQRQRRRGFPRP